MGSPAFQHKEVIGRKRVWISEKKRQSFNSSEAKRWGQWKSNNTRSKAGEQNVWEVMTGLWSWQRDGTSLGAPKDRVRGFEHRTEAKQELNSILLGPPLDGLQSTMLQPSKTYYRQYTTQLSPRWVLQAESKFPASCIIHQACMEICAPPPNPCWVLHHVQGTWAVL